MSRHLIRRLLLSAIALSLSLCPFMHSAAAGLPVHAGIFVVRLESDKAVYQLGEPIRLRVTVRNNTSRRYAVMWMQVWGLCDLTILNSEGQSLSSTGNLSLIHIFDTAAILEARVLEGGWTNINSSKTHGLIPGCGRFSLRKLLDRNQ